MATLCRVDIETNAYLNREFDAKGDAFEYEDMDAAVFSEYFEELGFTAEGRGTLSDISASFIRDNNDGEMFKWFCKNKQEEMKELFNECHDIQEFIEYHLFSDIEFQVKYEDEINSSIYEILKQEHSL